MQAATLEAFVCLKQDIHTGRASSLKRGVLLGDGREVIVKSYKQDAEATAEAHFLRTLQPCVNACSLIQVLELGPQRYILLDPYSSDLHSLLRRHHQSGMPLAHVRQLGAQILNALDFMHDRQIAYLALQPRNVMLQPPPGGAAQGSVVKLIHFKQAQQLPAKGGVVVDFRPASMLRYDAPELLAGGKCTTAADIFSFGCLLGEMLIGRPVFNVTNPRDMLVSVIRALGLPPPRMQALMRRDPGLREVLTQLGGAPGDAPLEKRLAVCRVDEELRGAVMACLILDPEERPTAKQLLRHVFKGVVDTLAFQELQQRHEQQQLQLQHQHGNEDGTAGSRSIGTKPRAAAAQDTQNLPEKTAAAALATPPTAVEGDRLSPARMSPARLSPSGMLLEAERSSASPSRRTSSSGGGRPCKLAILAMPGAPPSSSSLSGASGAAAALSPERSMPHRSVSPLGAGQHSRVSSASSMAPSAAVAALAAPEGAPTWGQGGKPLAPSLRARAYSDGGALPVAALHAALAAQPQPHPPPDVRAASPPPRARSPGMHVRFAGPGDATFGAQPQPLYQQDSASAVGQTPASGCDVYYVIVPPAAPEPASPPAWQFPSSMQPRPPQEPRLSDPGRALLERQSSPWRRGLGELDWAHPGQVASQPSDVAAPPGRQQQQNVPAGDPAALLVRDMLRSALAAADGGQQQQQSQQQQQQQGGGSSANLQPWGVLPFTYSSNSNGDGPQASSPPQPHAAATSFLAGTSCWPADEQQEPLASEPCIVSFAFNARSLSPAGGQQQQQQQQPEAFGSTALFMDVEQPVRASDPVAATLADDRQRPTYTSGTGTWGRARGGVPPGGSVASAAGPSAAAEGGRGLPEWGGGVGEGGVRWEGLKQQGQQLGVEELGAELVRQRSALRLLQLSRQQHGAQQQQQQQARVAGGLSPPRAGSAGQQPTPGQRDSPSPARAYSAAGTASEPLQGSLAGLTKVRTSSSIALVPTGSGGRSTSPQPYYLGGGAHGEGGFDLRPAAACTGSAGPAATLSPRASASANGGIASPSLRALIKTSSAAALFPSLTGGPSAPGTSDPAPIAPAAAAQAASSTGVAPHRSGPKLASWVSWGASSMQSSPAKLPPRPLLPSSPPTAAHLAAARASSASEARSGV